MFRGVNIDYLVPDTGEEEPIPPKPVSEITLLDPACGTMHFGQYAYSIFYEMYLEEGIVPPADIPNAILQNNLFGVDIDPRAIQIAALALLLTMKEQARVHGLRPEALRVRGMNLVCANSVNLGDEEREKLLKRLNPEMFGGDVPMKRAVEALWENLEHVGELGSLIQVDDSVERALGQVATWRMKFVDEKQMTLGDEPEWGALQATLTAEERTTARDYLLGELQRLAAGKGNGDMMAQLFAQETEKGLRLLEVLGRKYDAVVMNPPYGDGIDVAEETLHRLAPRGKNNLYACFVERSRDLLQPTGHVGCLSERMWMCQTTMLRFRSEVMLGEFRIVTLADLSLGVLDDAMNRLAAYVISPVVVPPRRSAFINLQSPSDKRQSFEQALASNGDYAHQVFRIEASRFLRVSEQVLTYRISDQLLSTLSSGLDRLDPDFGHAYAGMQSCDDPQFVRRAWEVTDTARWVPFAKGEVLTRYYYHNDLAVDWGSDGRRLKDFARQRYGSVTRKICNEQHYLTPGLTWADAATRFRVTRLPAGAIFSHCGFNFVPVDQGAVWTWAALLNSAVVEYYLMLQYDGHHWRNGLLSTIPVPAAIQVDPGLPAHSRRCHDLIAGWDTGNETCTRFSSPWLLSAAERDQPGCEDWRTLGDILACCLDWEEQRSAECQRLQDEIDDIVYDLYEITPEDRELIERELGERPPETVWPQIAGKSREEKRLEHVLRLLSYIAKTTCEEDEDGIVPLVPCGEEPTLLERARRKLDEFFGADRGHEIEAEINSELRVRLKGNRNCGPRMDMETWFATRYFDYHVSLYKKRPIFWHIQSEDGSFGALCHYHKLNRNRLQKLRAHHLATFMDRLRREIGELQSDESKEARARLERLEGNLRSAEELSRKLGLILTGEPDPKTGEQYRIHVRWKSEEEQPKGWDPDIDDGVKVNITPLQEAGVLAARKVV